MQIADRSLKYILGLGACLTYFPEENLGGGVDRHLILPVFAHAAVPNSPVELALNAFSTLWNAPQSVGEVSWIDAVAHGGKVVRDIVA